MTEIALKGNRVLYEKESKVESRRKKGRQRKEKECMKYTKNKYTNIEEDIFNSIFQIFP